MTQLRNIFVLCLFSVTLLSAANSFSQANELNSLVEKLQSSLTKVETGSKTYEQEIKLVEYASVRYSYSEVDQKGNKTAYAYEFNIGDIDVYAVRQVTQKDVITVILSIKNKQKLVKGIKNGEVLAYDNEVTFRAKDADQAGQILETIKKCIPLGEKITASKLKLKGYDEMIKWLTTNVKDVAMGTKAITQNIKPDSYAGSFKLLQIENDGKSSQQEEFIFNLADINLNTINFKVNGNRFGLTFETMQQLKSVKSIRDGKPRPFNGEVLIYTNNVDEARDIKTVLTLLVPFAIDKVKSDLPNFKTKEESLDKIFSFVKDVKLGDKTEGQMSTMKCITEIVIVEQTNSSSTRNKYQFNWMDINASAVQVKTSGEKMTIQLPTLEKKKLIMYSKNDKFEGYDNEISVYTEDYEIARRLRHAIEKTIDACKASYKDPYSATNAGMMTWLKANVGEVIIDQATKKQAIELAEEGNENKIKLTTTDVKSNSSVQEIFEFNLSDINPTTVNYEIKGKWLYVSFETNFKNKIIKAYKDGKIQAYAYSVDLVMKDVETARGTAMALKKLAESFKGKQ